LPASNEADDLIGSATSAVSKHERNVVPEQSYKEMVEAMSAAAVRLFALEQTTSISQPKAGRLLLNNARPERTWAVVLAWIVLRSTPWHRGGSALFDKLQLRAALAEIFSSMGMEGEDMWRAAALVRILLSQPNATASERVHTEAFWADPDVRWEGGVNTASGVTYFSKEGFEELIRWLQLPALIEIAQRSSGAGSAIAEVAAAVAKDCQVAHEAGYRLDTYLSEWNAEEDEPLEVIASKPAVNSSGSFSDSFEVEPQIKAELFKEIRG